jgi:hemoglobin
MSDAQLPHPEETIQPQGTVFSHEDLRLVVDGFYNKVAVDPLLKVPFSSVHDWPEHIARLTHFWWIRLGGKPYMFTHYNPIQKHFYAGFNETFLERWLSLFHETMREHLKEEQVQVWKAISENMGRVLNQRNEALKKMNPTF